MPRYTVAQVAKWEEELRRIRCTRSRWGETRRFAGRSAGLRLEKIDRLVARISSARAYLDEQAKAR